MKRLSRIIILLALAAAWGLLAFPMYAEKRSAVEQEMKIGGYDEQLQEKSATELAEEAALAARYNEKIRQSQKESQFFYQGELAGTDDPDYQGIASGSEELGYIEIPKISLRLPFGRGTASAMLEYMAGHMYGTSLPGGTGGTHCVLTAHTGLASGRKLFTDLTELSVGDSFTVHMLDMKYTYTVAHIITVLPEEADSRLQIEDGHDMCTLYTCTPYGVNTHRLLVRGELTTYERESHAPQGGSGTSHVSGSHEMVAKYTFLYALPIAAFLAMAAYAAIPQRKEKKETEA